ncbi:MAG: hypothetical protein IPJ06_00775 [Saprospiraceae bacterium]|nr:hypothetical protein [Saprospiraceae bacterium]
MFNVYLIATQRSLMAILALVLLWTIPTFAQTEDAPPPITLLDADTGLPISFAHFACGDYQGISNEKGECHCPSTQCQDFQLSHLEYGQRILTAEECAAMRQGQVLRWERQAGIILQPVTVLALHQGNRPQAKHQFDNQDWLAHDAGDVLTRSPVLPSSERLANMDSILWFADLNTIN